MNSDEALIAIKPGPNDVIMGRGGGINKHPGNVKFRNLVTEHKMWYLCCNKIDKPEVARHFVQLWRKMIPPGRFLTRLKKDKPGTASEYDDNDNYEWCDVGDIKARKKASQCLRERTPQILPFLKQLRESKQSCDPNEFSSVAGYPMPQHDYAKIVSKNFFPQVLPGFNGIHGVPPAPTKHNQAIGFLNLHSHLATEQQQRLEFKLLPRNGLIDDAVAQMLNNPCCHPSTPHVSDLVALDAAAKNSKSHRDCQSKADIKSESKAKVPSLCDGPIDIKLSERKQIKQSKDKISIDLDATYLRSDLQAPSFEDIEDKEESLSLSYDYEDGTEYDEDLIFDDGIEDEELGLDDKKQDKAGERILSKTYKMHGQKRPELKRDLSRVASSSLVSTMTRKSLDSISLTSLMDECSIGMGTTSVSICTRDSKMNASSCFDSNLSLMSDITNV